MYTLLLLMLRVKQPFAYSICLLQGVYSSTVYMLYILLHRVVSIAPCCPRFLYLGYKEAGRGILPFFEGSRVKSVESRASLLMSYVLVIIFKSGYLVWLPCFFDDSVVTRGNTEFPACYTRPNDFYFKRSLSAGVLNPPPHPAGGGSKSAHSSTAEVAGSRAASC